jgi:hypothetical protein
MGRDRYIDDKFNVNALTLPAAAGAGFPLCDVSPFRRLGSSFSVCLGPHTLPPARSCCNVPLTSSPTIFLSRDTPHRHVRHDGSGRDNEEEGGVHQHEIARHDGVGGVDARRGRVVRDLQAQERHGEGPLHDIPFLG